MIIPPSNLPDTAMPWVRSQEGILTSNVGALNALDGELNATYKGQNATLQLLSEQIKNLSIQAMSLPIITATYMEEANGPGFTGTGIGNYTTVKSQVIPMPDGKTQANVFVAGTMYINSYATGGNYYYARVGINGNYSNAALYSSSDSFALGHVASVTGTSFTVTAQVSASSGGSAGKTQAYFNVLSAFI